MEKVKTFLTGKRKIDANYWREIVEDPKAAKEALVNLVVNGNSVTELTLESGNTIPVTAVTEKQAHDFMKALCPSWAKPKDT